MVLVAAVVPEARSAMWSWQFCPRCPSSLRDFDGVDLLRGDVLEAVSGSLTEQGQRRAPSLFHIVHNGTQERDVAAREFGALMRVERMAVETLKAIRATAVALAEAEKAVDVVERAKGKPEDPVRPGSACITLSLALPEVL